MYPLHLCCLTCRQAHVYERPYGKSRDGECSKCRQARRVREWRRRQGNRECARCKKRVIPRAPEWRTRRLCDQCQVIAANDRYRRQRSRIHTDQPIQVSCLTCRVVHSARQLKSGRCPRCSAVVASRAAAQKAKKDKQHHDCEICGKKFPHNSSSANRCCSRKCGFEWMRREAAAKAKPRPKFSRVYCSTCAQCSGAMVTRTKRKYCSADCSAQAALAVAREKAMAAFTPEIFDCRECGKRVETEYGNPRKDYCSDECSNRRFRRDAKHRRRTVYRKGDKIPLKQLHARDSGRCHLCGKAVDIKKRQWPDGASVDHIVPVSMGGSHTWDNVALAHIECNSLRGATGPAQLPLILPPIELRPAQGVSR